MAHGSPRINVCHRCKQYTLVPRFSDNPQCPNCKGISEQTSREELITRYKLSRFFYDFMLNFNHWEKIPVNEGIKNIV